jgi:hypothetical protein
MKVKLLLFFVLMSCYIYLHADKKKDTEDLVRFSGSLQLNGLFPQEDTRINTEPYNDIFLNNSYLNVNIDYKNLIVGASFEYLEYPLPGYEQDFAGSGIKDLFLTYKSEKFSITAGNIYDEFGSGLIFRTYENRSLGINNALIGGRLTFNPLKGVDIKIIGGKQRRYWRYNNSFVWGSNIKISLDDWSSWMNENEIFMTLDVSYAGKYERRSNDYVYAYVEGVDSPDLSGGFQRLVFPDNVGATDFRMQFQKGDVSLSAEYAVKSADPSTDNSYIYKYGNATLFSASYSKRGMSLLAQAKRSDNMSFRSVRNAQGTASFINHQPAFSQQHTYALAAIYPYATQPVGEWAFQGEVSYFFDRNSLIGGKYGTTVRVNFSHIRDIERRYIIDNQYVAFAKLGYMQEYESSFFASGKEVYYQDFNIEISKKWTNALKTNMMYMNLRYNPKIVGHNEQMITSNIFILENYFSISRKVTLRSEIQYLATSSDESLDEVPSERSNQGDWMFGLLELSVSPNFMFTVSDMYNSGTTKLHYGMVSSVLNYRSHRIGLAFGRTRAGYDCSGGICRFVPASKGFRIDYSVIF